MIINSPNIVKKIETNIPEFLRVMFDTHTEKLKGNIFIAGGFLTSIFSGTDINDIDIFCKDITSFNYFYEVMRNIYLKFNTLNACTFTHGTDTIQLIKPKCMSGDLQSIIDKFDFSISMAGYDYYDKVVLCNDNFIVDIASKVLRYNPNSVRPLSTLYRLKKMLRRGYTINGIELIKLGIAISKLNIESLTKYQNEVQGIDSHILEKHFIDIKKKAMIDGKFSLDAVLKDLEENYTDI